MCLNCSKSSIKFGITLLNNVKDTTYNLQPATFTYQGLIEAALHYEISICVTHTNATSNKHNSDFQIGAQLEEHGISTYKFAFTPENGKDNWMCDLAPFAVVGSNTIIQVDDTDYHDHARDEVDYDGNAGQYLSPQIET